MPTLTTIYTAAPRTITPVPAPHPDPLIRTHRIHRDATVQVLIERPSQVHSTLHITDTITQQERLDATPLHDAPRHLGLPRKSKASLAP